MDEGALASLRRPRSSVAVACQLVRRGDAAAVVSAGSTGGIVATARLRLRAQPGVLRPGLAVVLPTRPGRTVLIDAGATADPKPEMLVQFGQLGVAYAQTALGVARAPGGAAHDRDRAGQGQQVHPPRARAAGQRPAARRPPAQLRGQRGGRRPAGRPARRDRDRRLHRERGAEDARGLDPVRRGRAARGGHRHPHRPRRRVAAAQRAARAQRPARRGELRRRRPARPGRHRGDRARRQHRPRRHLRLPAGGGPGPRPDHGEDHPAAGPGPLGHPRRPLPAPPVTGPAHPFTAPGYRVRPGAGRR